LNRKGVWSRGVAKSFRPLCLLCLVVLWNVEGAVPDEESTEFDTMEFLDTVMIAPGFLLEYVGTL